MSHKNGGVITKRGKFLMEKSAGLFKNTKQMNLPSK